MNRTLYVTDLDGTLMRDDKTISPETIRILNAFIDQGMLFTCATARSANSACKITRDIRFPLPIIVRNGTMLADVSSQNRTEILQFTHEEVSAVRQCIAGESVPGFVTSYIHGNEEILYRKGASNKGFDHYLANHADDKRLRAVSTEEELYQGAPCYFTFIAERSDLEPLYKRVNSCDQCSCIFQKDKYRGEYWLEIFPKGATKANAILRLKQKYGCEKLVVFGDSLNDISMFQIADEAYAMENADEELKTIATGIIGDNNSDSVAEWLKTHIHNSAPSCSLL